MSKEENILPLVELGGGTIINLEDVAFIGKLTGDPAYLGYTVKFTSGEKLEIYQRREICDFYDRDKLVKLYKEVKCYSNTTDM